MNQYKQYKGLIIPIIDSENELKQCKQIKYFSICDGISCYDCLLAEDNINALEDYIEYKRITYKLDKLDL